MKYIYIPDTYDDKVNEIDDFLNLQVKYREAFELYLKEKINFQDIDVYIESLGVDIPTINDTNYNFYHKYSILGSKYIFFRNNIHIENLNDEEIDLIYEAIETKTRLNEEFLLKTYERVLYEEGDAIFFGYPVMECLVKSKSLVFEFAYDQKLCKSAKQIFDIDDITGKVLNLLEKAVKTKFDFPISCLVYNAIPDEFYDFSKDEDNDSVIQ